jgi:hypothetical protein
VVSSRPAAFSEGHVLPAVLIRNRYDAWILCCSISAQNGALSALYHSVGVIRRRCRVRVSESSFRVAKCRRIVDSAICAYRCRLVGTESIIKAQVCVGREFARSLSWRTWRGAASGIERIERTKLVESNQLASSGQTRQTLSLIPQKVNVARSVGGSCRAACAYLQLISDARHKQGQKGDYI